MSFLESAQNPVAKQGRASVAAGRKREAAASNKAAPSRSDIVAKLLARPRGATIAEVSSATGWQPHSVRAFFSGLRKKGLALEREARKDGTSSYQLAAAAKPTTPAATTAPSPSDEGTTVVIGG